MSNFVVICHSHDLDNILLENIGDMQTLQAVFELEALVLTGIIGFSLVYFLLLCNCVSHEVSTTMFVMCINKSSLHQVIVLRKITILLEAFS